MTLPRALTAPVAELTPAELNSARGVIGAEKLERRRAANVDWCKFPGGRGVDGLVEFLRTANKRLDLLNAVDMAHQANTKLR